MMDETTDNAEDLVARYRAAFPTIELPRHPFEARSVAPTSNAASPATDLDGRPVGGVDEPAGAWRNPLPDPAAQAPTGYTWQVAPPQPGPVATPGVVPAPDPVPVAVMPSAAPVAGTGSATAEPAPNAMRTPPPMQVAPEPTVDEVPAIAPPKAVVVVMVILVALLVWASRMAFSAAVLGIGALVASELAISLSLARRSGQPRPTASTALAVFAALGAAATTWLAVRELTDEFAFVAGLFVLITVVPTLLVLGAVLLMLRRVPAGAPVAALRTGVLRLLPVLGATLLAGVQAHRTFSAKPDAIVAGIVVVLVAINVLAVLRGSGRAAESAAGA